MTLKIIITLVVFLSGFIGQLVRAEDDLDAVLGGFEGVGTVLPARRSGDDSFDALKGQPTTVIQTSSSLPTLPSWLALSGAISFSSSYSISHAPPQEGQTDYRGFSSLRPAFDLDAEIFLPRSWKVKIGARMNYDTVYSLKGRDQFSEEVLEDYEDEFELSELYLQGSLLSQVDLKIGRQVVVWGKSDNIRVTDLLNPLDNREPGLVDMRDLRLPVAMSKIDFYQNPWSMSAIIIHENRFNKNPVYGNDFYPGTTPAIQEEKLSIALENQEYALAISGIFSGWDVSFYSAHLFDDLAHLEGTSTGLKLRHSRIDMLGSAVNVVRGSFLWKGEVAYLHGLEYSIDVGHKGRMDMLAGFEYTGISETVLSFELVNRHIISFDQRLKDAPVYGQENEVQYALRVGRDYYNDVLQLTGLLSFFGITGEDGAMQRLSCQYDWSDSTSFTLGVAFYQDGEKAFFRNIGDNDRLFFKVRYSF